MYWGFLIYDKQRACSLLGYYYDSILNIKNEIFFNFNKRAKNGPKRFAIPSIGDTRGRDEYRGH